jgi:resuscitation-promoting factor RpfB
MYLLPTGPRTVATRRRRRTRSLTSRTLALSIGLLLPLLGFTWLGTERSVTLVIDGNPVMVSSHAETVADLLDRAGVAVGPQDRVVPQPTTPLADGMVVEVVHAREITLLVGDQAEQVVIAALTVDEVLDRLQPRLGRPVGNASLLRPSRLSRVRSGMVVAVADPVPLVVRHDGHEQHVITDAQTVGAVLERLGLALGEDDIVTPSAETLPEAGMTIVVERVTTATETRTITIPFTTEQRRTAALTTGQQREVQAGRDGVLEIVEAVVRADGAVRSRAPVSERIIRDPVPRVVEVGTASPPKPTPAPPAPAPQPAAAPAPAPPADEAPPDSTPLPHTQEGKASWYDNPYGGMTAAHRTIPRGTIVTVTNVANGRQVQVRINDSGPYVEGRVIDLNREAFAALASPSVGVIRVRLEW